MGTCQEGNITYNDGDSFMRGLCITCQCDNGTVNCMDETCSECPEGTHPVNESNQCCPTCIPGETRSCDLQ